MSPDTQDGQGVNGAMTDENSTAGRDTKSLALGSICLFVAGLLIVHFFISSVYCSGIMVNSISQRTRAQFIAEGESAKVLVLGDSRGQVAIDPRIVPSSFNFCVRNAGYHQTYYQLERLLESETEAFELIVLPLEYYSFTSGHYGIYEDELLWGQFIDPWELGSKRGDHALWLGRWVRDRYFPYVGGHRNIFQCWDRYGFMPRAHEGVPMFKGYLDPDRAFPELSPAQRAADARRMGRRHYENRDLLDPLMLQYFDRCLDLCAAHRVRVLLIRFPYPHDYLDQARQVMSPEAFDERVLPLIEGRKTVQFLDLARLYLNADDCFRDGVHLNSKGAAEVSRRVAAIVLNQEAGQ